MANHRKDPKLKVHAICGSVKIETKLKLLREAQKQDYSPAKMVGEILNKWAKEQPALPPDKRQMNLRLEEKRV